MRVSQQQASVLVIALWIAFGLVSLALYFGQSMLFNLQAADNYEAGVEADQAIEGAARYVSFVLTNLQQQIQSGSTNMPGILIAPGSIQGYASQSGQNPFTQNYESAAVPVGGAKFWMIGRDPSGSSNATSEIPVFSLVDEASKINLNTATIDMLEALPFMTADLAASILNWRNSSTNITSGGAEVEYGMMNPPYACKNAPFETLDELKLVMGATTDILYGADMNLNGILEANENNNPTALQSGNNLDGGLNAGILEYVTVYSKEPTVQGDGTQRVNVMTPTAPAGLQTLLQTALGDSRASQIMQQSGATRTGFASILSFYIASGMTADEFAQVADGLSNGSGPYVVGMVNVNTATATVLACLPGIGTANAQTLITYRQAHPDQLATVAWVVQALGATTAVQAGPYITAKSYQFTADIAAVGHNGRGYRRTTFVFDTSSGSAQIIYRRPMAEQTWALGSVRKTLVQR